jgi:hypothetical protein
MSEPRHTGPSGRSAGRAALLLALLGALAIGALPRPPDDHNPSLPPRESEELTLRAGHLFDAVVQGRPELADDFFFPREPFLGLKDVADPARYHAELLSAYHRDIVALHARRRSWEGATFRAFELGTPPRRVRPGEEWNKIGYYRTFRGKLTYDAPGRGREPRTLRTLEIHTVISWDGRWYATHLLPIRR